MKQKQIRVYEFASQYFTPGGYKWRAFMKLMKDWDGRSDVGQSFYDVDVLQVKRQETINQTFGYGD